MPFLPGERPEPTQPLGRFLPPVPGGAAANWLAGHVPPGAWILDPFGSSPDLVVETARAGYRVLVAANNPIVRFLIEVYAMPPEKTELQAALAQLAASHKGEERLEPHLLNRYITRCERCESDIIADAFLWEKDVDAPYARIYSCPQCGDAGERAATEEDAFRASHFAATRLHTARALERAAPLHDPDREHIAKAMRFYPPRAVYALFTLINKLDALPLSVQQRRALEILLLAAFDRSNSLWTHPTERERPRQLVIPTRYRENNVWQALEQGVEWPFKRAAPTPLIPWPEQPGEEGGIVLFEGRLRDLVESAELPPLGAVVTALPRPNQAFWTLSALWSGWLWGAESITGFKSVLRRRRYGWDWHTAALHAVLRRLLDVLAPDARIFGLLPEAEPGSILAAMLASDLARLELAGLALRADEGQGQFVWHAGGHAEAADQDRTGRKNLVREAMTACLSARGEPASRALLFAAAGQHLAEKDSLSPPGADPREAYRQVRENLDEVLEFDSALERFGSLESGSWWLKDQEDVEPPLADRVEQALVEQLIERPGSTLEDIESRICTRFPGLLTPRHELIEICMQSYAEANPLDQGSWYLRKDDQPRLRRADLEEMRQILAEMGERLGYQVSGSQPLLWSSPDGPAAQFFVKASAVLEEIVLYHQALPDQSFIVIPGGRSRLVLYKLAQNPRLRAAVEGSWRFLKFRLLRRLGAASLTRETLEDQLNLDPLTYESPQMRMM